MPRLFALWRLWVYGLAFLALGFLLGACWWRAGVVTDAAECERVRVLLFDKNLLDPGTHWAKHRSVLIEVVPERIDYIDYGQGFGHKDVWEPSASA